MSGGSSCPHPEKLRWPLVDIGGPGCACGCVWEPYVFMTRRNYDIHKARAPGRLEVYRCRTRGGDYLDHWHTTDAAKRDRRIDEADKGPVASSRTIQDQHQGRSSEEQSTRTWSGHRRRRPVSYADGRRRLRHRR